MEINRKLRSKIARRSLDKIYKELDTCELMGVVRYSELINDMIYWSQWIY